MRKADQEGKLKGEEKRYERFFGMVHIPFTKQIPEKNLYLTYALEKTLKRLELVTEQQMFALLTADEGCGKTTLIRKFAASLDGGSNTVLYLSDSRVTPRELYQELLCQMKGDTEVHQEGTRKELYRQLETVRGIYDKNVIVIIDEAHLLPEETLQEIPFLFNYNMDSGNPLALILVGQNQLRDKLKHRRYAGIGQQLDLEFQIDKLQPFQIKEYIQTRLQYAGGDLGIFTEQAEAEIHRYTKGVPGMINKVCTHALIYAAEKGEREIDQHMINTVISYEIL